MASKTLELRKLMKQKAGQSKKINHPLAKYNNIGQLSCIICNQVIKNEIIWSAHLQSKRHKENVISVKSKPVTVAPPKQLPQPTVVKPLKSILKKPDDEVYEPVAKKQATSDLPSDFFDNTASQSQKEDDVKTTPETGLPSDFFDTGNSTQNSSSVSEEKIETDDTSTTATSSRKRDRSQTSYPNTNHFHHRKSVFVHTRKTSSSSEPLPEGFFDDPKKDAKARKVEYKDPKDVEWEKFQKLIQEETKISEGLQEEDDEQSEMFKDMAELNNMRSCLSRVENLKKMMRKNKTTQKDKKTQKHEEDSKVNKDVSNDTTSDKGDGLDGDDDDDDEEEDMDDLFDWRAKVA